MNLKAIEGYENLYSFDLNNNQVYSHISKKYIKPFLNNGYIVVRLYKNAKQKKIYFHRLVYELYHGTLPENMCIDHIDNNKLNNNITNLRLATYSQNGMNRKAQKNNLSTGYKCITITKHNNYQVRIYKNKKVVYNKTFKTLEEAINNRDLNLKIIHGDFYNFG